MHAAFLSLILAASFGQPAAQAEPPVAKQRTDAEGYPLPAEVVTRIGSARLRHGRWIRDLAYSPDGKLLASVGLGAFRLWEASSGKLVHHFPLGMHEFGEYEVRFAQDGKTLLMRDGADCHWFDVQTGKEQQICKLPIPGNEHKALLAPHGEALAMAASFRDKDLVVYDTRSGRELLRKSAGESAEWFGLGLSPNLAFSPDGKSVAAFQERGDHKHVFVLLRIADGKQLAEIEVDRHDARLAFSPDGQRFALEHEAHLRFGVGLLRIGKVSSGEAVCEVELAIRECRQLRFIPDSNLIAVSTDQGDVLLLDTTNGKELRRLRGDEYHCIMAVTPDGKTLATANRWGAISQWDLATGKRRAASSDPLTLFEQLTFDRDSKLLWTVSSCVAAYDVRSGREVRRLAQPPDNTCRELALSLDRSRIAGITNDQKLTVWDAATGKVLSVIPEKVQYLYVGPFSADARTLYARTLLDPVHGWDVATARQVLNLRVERMPLEHLTLARNGRWLAVEHRKEIDKPSEGVTVLELPQGREACRVKLPSKAESDARLAFSLDGRYLAAAGASEGFGLSGAPGFLATWDLRTGKQRIVRSDLPDWATAITFAPDGRMLATGTYGGTISVWETATGQERRKFTGHTDFVHEIAFSPDGKLLAAVSGDAPLYIWDLTGNHDKPPVTTPFTPAEEDRLWKTLAGADAAAAFQAMHQLLARPTHATALLAGRLRPVVRVDSKALEQQIRALDADDFDTRKRALEELKKADDQAEPLLRQAIQKKPSPEARRQIEELLKALENVSAEQLRQLRAVEVLEQLGTDEARKLLEKLAGGAKDTLLTREAQASVERLGRP